MDDLQTDMWCFMPSEISRKCCTIFIQHENDT